ncbi:uncharacterized protein DS421_3g86970 [Arachis hypogaea]|nr:uncharacterized protein DS421_3g86970 [Arachis hypogaea]
MSDCRFSSPLPLLTTANNSGGRRRAPWPNVPGHGQWFFVHVCETKRERSIN